jgi:signal peptidase I
MQPETQSGDVIVINKLLMGPRLSPNECSKYVRAWGYSQLKHNDLIIFNFPEGDTILNNHPTDSYYALKRTNSYNFNSDSIGEKSYRTVAHRPRYIKRVIGLPGDTFQIIQSQLYINHQIIIPSEHYIAKYEILDTLKAEQLLIKHEIVPIARISYQRKKIIELDASLLKSHPDLSSSLKTFYLERNMPDPNVFPHTFMWNSDNMGPLVIPGKGDVIDINIKNIDIYARIIGVYEQNKLEVKGKKIFINGNEAVKYTFKMNYYWVMGDNQPHSFDSRYWGFLPENHIIGISRTHLRF